MAHAGDPQSLQRKESGQVGCGNEASEERMARAGYFKTGLIRPEIREIMKEVICNRFIMSLNAPWASQIAFGSNFHKS